MAEPKKKDFEDPVNVKIQRKFDLIFGQQESPKESSSAEVKSTTFNHSHDYFDNDSNLDRDMSMSDDTQKKPAEGPIPSPSLDFDMDQEISGDNIEFSGQHEVSASAEEPAASKDHLKLAIDPNDNGDGLEFDLDFSEDVSAGSSFTNTSAMEANKESTKSNSHFELDLDEVQEDDFQLERTGVKTTEDLAPVFEEENEPLSEIDAMFDEAIADAQNHMPPEGTQKTIVYDKKLMGSVGFGSPDTEMVADSNSTADFMSSEEAKANIDATIKDILRPKNNDNTQEIDISAMVQDAEEEDQFKEFRSEASISANEHSLMNSGPPTNVFDLNSIEFAGKESTSEDIFQDQESSDESIEEQVLPPPVITPLATTYGYSGNMSDEESSRLQGTIRQLREEREDFLMQIKKLKGEGRELEQDNLTLQAALDESKIEVSILRKRHMVELEDIKYRLSVNEEKKAMAIEQARLAESKREKLEQRVRIDFNQVKQREKELETKLEMLSIDVDSQVQSRDQKILELRRKIDALEFNMENVSIKEQKSHDDKRKLEDKLNKIMKTLRHSIKNLEDDIDQANDETQDVKNTDGLRSKA